ncbi:MAG: ABC transporter ATP-binding protein [Pseudomonadota bacterium]
MPISITPTTSLVTPAIIELQDIHFSYVQATMTTPVLLGTSLALREGQRIGLLGDNGSGKTTLLHVAMGLLQPSSGAIIHAGTVLPISSSQCASSKKASQALKPALAALRRDLGFLFQNSDDQLFCPTVLEDVAFGPLNLGLTSDEARQTALETLGLLNLQDFAQRVTHKLSGGEKKMVALASIMSMAPKALLLDEPTNDLDAATRAHLIDILTSHSHSHIIISHDWDFLHRTCDIFLTMKDGMLTETPHAPHVHVHTHQGGSLAHRHR